MGEGIGRGYGGGGWILSWVGDGGGGMEGLSGVGGGDDGGGGVKCSGGELLKKGNGGLGGRSDCVTERQNGSLKVNEEVILR